MKVQYVCTQCGFIGKPKKHTKGSFLVELFLWFLLIIPGLIYSVWRATTKISVCPKCKHESMIPGDSPMGKKLIDSHSETDTKIAS